MDPRSAQLLVRDIRHALDHITSAGSFASVGALPPVSPGLVVEGVGAISLPLQESQARQIIDKARQSPYGKGEETVVDTSVRNTWELDPDQFELTDPQWKNLVATIVAHVGNDLGVGSLDIRAELYKMLIYEKGAMFKAHTE
jgi:hypothetical protein